MRDAKAPAALIVRVRRLVRRTRAVLSCAANQSAFQNSKASRRSCVPDLQELPYEHADGAAGNPASSWLLLARDGARDGPASS